jgi:Protein of unknown function DUF45
MAAMPVRKADTPPIPLPSDSYRRLQSLADEVHRTYFFKYPPLPVRWGQQISRKKRRSIRLGSYNHGTTEVRIHPILTMAPAFFIQSVIYHEYLHHVLGPHHNSRFHRAERQFRYYRESQEWVRRNLWTLLGRKRDQLRRVAPAQTAEPVQAALF